MSQTVFGDLRERAVAVYRVTTQASVYIVGFHEQRGRKFVIVRGAPGTDREAVVVRDSDPRVGEHSLFELPPTDWVGKSLEIATMTSSPVTAVVQEGDPSMIAAVGVDGHVRKNPWARPDPTPTEPAGFTAPRPPFYPEAPRMIPVQARATTPAGYSHDEIARQVVVGQQPPQHETELPYPIRHVRYAENCAALLRSILRRDRIFEDLAGDLAERDRLRRSLDEIAILLEQIRRRDRA